MLQLTSQKKTRINRALHHVHVDALLICFCFSYIYTYILTFRDSDISKTAINVSHAMTYIS